MSFIKKFAEEFKAFALQGNVVDMAIGVIIGAAFKDIVTSFTDNFINPLLACIGGSDIHGTIPLGSTGQALNYGAFLSAVVNFIIMALVLFLMLKGINSLKNIGKRRKKDDEEDEAVLLDVEDIEKAGAADTAGDGA